MIRLPVNASVATLGGGAVEIVFILIVFFCILLLAYAVTRFIAKRVAGRLKSRYLEVIDTLAVGADAQLLIVKAGEEIFLAAKSQKHISLLSKLDLDIEDTREGAGPAPGFAESFRTVLEGKLSLVRNKSTGVFRDNIEKIKDISDMTEKLTHQ